VKSKSLLKILISDKKVGSACEEYEDNEGGILGECVVLDNGLFNDCCCCCCSCVVNVIAALMTVSTACHIHSQL